MKARTSAQHPQPAGAARHLPNSHQSMGKCCAIKVLCVAVFCVCSVALVEGKAGVTFHEEIIDLAEGLGNMAIGINRTAEEDRRKSPPEMDLCLKKCTYYERAECLQPLMEMYFLRYVYNQTRSGLKRGQFLSALCPNLGMLLAQYECQNCPWNLVDPSSDLSRALFHAAGKECRVVDHVEFYADIETLRRVWYRASIAVALMILVLSVLGITSGKQVKVLGKKAPEAAYLGIYWSVFNWCTIVWARTQDYLSHCESLSTILSDSTTRYVAYATVLFVSISRCVKLPSNIDEIRESRSNDSWMSLVSEVFANWERKSRRKRALSVVVVILVFLMLTAFGLPLVVSYEVGNRKAPSVCSGGGKDYAMGVIQMSKLVLQTLSVVIYALGPQKSRFRSRLRFLGLVSVLLSSFIVFSLTFTKLYKPLGLSTLIPRALDSDIATPFHEVVHAIFIALLGLLEPWRMEKSDVQTSTPPAYRL